MIEQRITELYEEKREDLLKIYYSRAGASDVEDLVQEAFYRALLYKDSYDERLAGDLEFWFISIMNNCLKDLMREKQGQGNLHRDLEEEDLGYEVCYDSKEFMDIIKSEIIKTKKNKDVVYLSFVLGCKPKEISKRLGKPLHVCYNATHRFASYLKEKFPEFKLES